MTIKENATYICVGIERTCTHAVNPTNNNSLIAKLSELDSPIILISNKSPTDARRYIKKLETLRSNTPEVYSARQTNSLYADNVGGSLCSMDQSAFWQNITLADKNKNPVKIDTANIIYLYNDEKNLNAFKAAGGELCVSLDAADAQILNQVKELKPASLQLPAKVIS